MIKTKNIIKINHLSIAFPEGKLTREVLKNITFEIYPNEILGVVGESGSGKSLTSLSILQLLPKNAIINSGEIIFENQDLLQLPSKEMHPIRGNEISMIFQEPMSSLNPSMTCGKQVDEIIIRHLNKTKKEAKAKTIELFKQVKLPRPEHIYESYPHQISGGQKQRVMIAMAIACEPKLLIADEPTTALDVTVQNEIILLLKELQTKNKMSILFITHDLSLVSEIADRIMVMHQGKIVEINTTKELFEHPKEKYTQALLASKPTTKERLKKLPTVKDFLGERKKFEIETQQERAKRHQKIYSQPPLLEVENVEKIYFNNTGLFQKKESFKAVNAVSFKIYEGETLGLVGESGCGKSTLSEVILKLTPLNGGKIKYRGEDITKLDSKSLRALRKEIQLIFQDPFASLNPRISVGNAIMEPMKVHNIYPTKKEREQKALELLKEVGLEEEHFYRYPHEFSGGQRQRIGIARTIAVNPKLIICDESVSALDISVQAQVLNLLNRLKVNYGFTYIFISHDLAVVKYMADQLLVMHQGEIVERGDADKMYDNPEKAYTQKLIEAIPKGI
ncbi:ABC transporter ATP-binding protein [Mesonia sp. K7]|uniref:ABC transporter ATP-binding protein n=1 Tax=Mesonia sp. K7 TaxID=2218606 RepID=UPI000DA9007B|nr:ABC transporter ATP-binding protein [Mesonia sp. K7]PZD77429.1 ABC transporter ATP-binding protein [Mesonia sp. K7]